MQGNSASLSGDADLQQVTALCHELNERVETARSEQTLLEQLVETTEQTRPHRARQYQVLLDEVRGRYRRFRDLLVRFCV